MRVAFYPSPQRTEGKTVTDIRIAMLAPDEYWTSHYGITLQSVFVHEISGQSQNRHYPHRFKVWSNLNRPNTDGTHKYTDPMGKGTDNPTSVTVSAEASVISAHGDGTGSKASGQVWGEAVSVGDTVRLVTTDGLVGAYRIDYHRWSGLSLTPVDQ